MRIIKVCLVGIMSVVLESVLCVGRFAGLFSGLFLLSAVVELIQHGAVTHLVATSLFGVLLCVIIPIMFGVIVEGLRMLEDRMIR